MNQKLSIDIITQGYFEREDAFVCLHCGQEFQQAEIFKIDDAFYNSTYAIKQHIDTEHGGALKAVLSLPHEVTGLTDTQKNLMALLSLDLTDDEIADQLDISKSTIRNHRFKLKEKKKQALYYVAAMELLEKRNKKLKSEEVSVMNYDQRFDISEKDREKVLTNFLDADGRATGIPRKEKSKIILLEHLVKKFGENQIYSEAEVNELIATQFDDYVTMRRTMIQYGFLGRTNDGKKYWKI